MAGLTTTGIDIDTLDELLSAIEADELATIDPGLNMNPDDVLGQLNGIIAAALAKAHELIEELYQSAYADTATGQSLSYIAALTGAIRRAATKSEWIVTLEGTPFTVVPSGTQFYPDSDPTSVYETVQSNDLGAGGNATVTAFALETGPGPRGLVTDTVTIATPVAGLNNVNPPFNSVDGKLEETDSELRFRREQSLSLAGASTVPAIRADVLGVTGVDTCTVFENATAAPDANGLPPYSIEVLVRSTGAPNYDNQAVADQIWASKPAGTETFGGITETVTDSQGNTHTVKFSEPNSITAYVEVSLTQDPSATYIGDANVAKAIEDWATKTLRVGQDVFASDIINVVADLEGVLSVDVLNTQVDDQTPTVSTDLVIASRDLATIVAANVTVSS